MTEVLVPRVAYPVVASVVALVVFAAGAPASSATVSPGAASASSRESYASYNILFGVLASSASQAYAVGTGGPDRARALTWDGTSWESTNPPGRVPSELYDVTEVDGKVWASGNDVGLGLVLRLHGDRWRQVPTPPPGAGLGQFIHAIDGTSNHDVWAAGYETPGDGSRAPLMLHWDGAGWTRYEVPLPLDATDGAINGMVVTGPDDAWAVGIAGPGSLDLTMIAHWDGLEWTARTDLITPSGDRRVLWGLDASGPDDVWAVGDDGDGPGALHWDGRVWSWVAVDVEVRSGIDLLYGVTVIDEGDVWAVGGHGRSFPPENARMVHWNGTRWKEVKVPTPGEAQYLTAVDSVSSNDVWAVGTFRRAGEDIQRHLYLHWDGHRWSRVRLGRADTVLPEQQQ